MERMTIIEIANIVSNVASEYISNSIIVDIEEKNIYLDKGMDSSLFYYETGWKPKYTMRDTVESIFKYYIEIKGRIGK
jgi:nucleoside-diphosphate-sugar epimerase